MKTLEELYDEIQTNDVLKEKFIAAAKENALADFLKKHDCAASPADVMDFMKGVQEGEMCDDDLDKVAGGNCGSGSCNTCDCQTYTCNNCTITCGCRN